MTKHPTIQQLATDLQTGSTTSSALIEACLDKISDASGEGSTAFIQVDAASARRAAAAYDQLRQAGVSLSPLMGLPVSIKDLFDIEGQVTRAGSRILTQAAPATSDSAIVALLRQAGAIIIGRTNMTEFAYSGLGLNPHYGTPASPFDRRTRRIPGGSSSGAGVSVADEMAVVGMGTDTGGSVRIPAALCGVAGFKPTARRIPTAGMLPLSTSFDSIGPVAPSVGCCITIDQILTQTPVTPFLPPVLSTLRLAVPTGIALEEMDADVSRTFEAALTNLSKAGVQIDEITIESIENPDRPANGGTILSAEAYTWHKPGLERSMNRYDPRVSKRMLPAAKTSASEYINLLNWRQRYIKDTTQALQPYDALLMPTTPIISPSIAELVASDDAYFKANTLMLRNTSIINQLDGCALSVPCHRAGDPPVGLMVAGPPMTDYKILQIGLAIEALFQDG